MLVGPPPLPPLPEEQQQRQRAALQHQKQNQGPPLAAGHREVVPEAALHYS